MLQPPHSATLTPAQSASSRKGEGQGIVCPNSPSLREPYLCQGLLRNLAAEKLQFSPRTTHFKIICRLVLRTDTGNFPGGATAAAIVTKGLSRGLIEVIDTKIIFSSWFHRKNWSAHSCFQSSNSFYNISKEKRTPQKKNYG
ncbi:uncharacterized protein AAES06_025240 [Glossophaga mutica]